jgi:heat-inducible transcriptional repressor
VDSGSDQLNARTRHLLKVLVEHYIQNGLPVGSRTLAQESGLDISSATVRNIMAELEERGLVSSPHTSAGRIPTDKGYRIFIDSLLTIEPFDHRAIEPLKALIEQGVPLQALAISVSSLLSGMSHMAGVVMLPRRERLVLRHVEFVPMSEGRVLALLVLNDREVHSTMIRLGRAFDPSELEQVANYLNRTFAGRDMADIRKTLLDELKRTQDDMDRVMYAAIQMAEKAFSITERPEDIIVSGQTNLMEFDELSDLDRLRVLFETFEEKRKILHLLDRCMTADGVRVFIGKESGSSALEGCSLVTSTYEVDGQVVGVLGVLGPTRMAYKKVIPLVDITAKMVSAALRQYH